VAETTSTLPAPLHPVPPSAWRLDWLTPMRCRLILALFVLVGFAGHLIWLQSKSCPIDLSGDEAHYWDWSRQLDLAYYSKGPAVAYIIRASCAVFGDTMWAVRLPALLFAAVISVLAYWLTRKCFGSDKLALGAALLPAAVPMFVAGSTLMTIDPPMLTCWAAATCLTAVAVLDDRRWPWPLVGLFAGLGALAKYGMLLWFVGLAVLLFVDKPLRKHLKSPLFWLMPLIALACLTPVIVWNARHGWVTFGHVGTQTGALSDGSRKLWLNPLNTLEMLGGQLGALNPIIAFFAMAACGFATLRAFTPDREGRALRMLLATGATFFALNLLASLRTKIQVNWPAPSYFTLLIITAWGVGLMLRDRELWRKLRGWWWGGVIGVGVVATVLLHNMPLIYPLVPASPRNYDPTVGKMVGFRELGKRLSWELEDSRPGTFILCEDYQVAAQAAFYTRGQPRTYYASSWFANPQFRRRLTQYDVWPDRALDQPSLIGRDALYVGYVWSDEGDNHELLSAFDSVDKLYDEEIERNGVKVRRFLIARCHNFRGLTRPEGRPKM
jgi:undecaprenyl-diphosphatase